MIALQNRSRLLAPLSLAILFASACSKENKVDQSQRNSYDIDQTTNGVLPGPDGLQLQLTQGSVKTPVTIELNEASPGDYAAPPASFMASGKVYAFEPHGLKFEHPIVINLPAAGGSGAITSELGGPWIQAQAALAGLFVQVQTDHFSFYVVTGGASNTGAPDAGKAGSDEDAGIIDPGSGTGGTGTGGTGTGGTGTSGTGTGGMPCMPSGSPPSGTTNATGSLGHMVAPATGIPFTAKDGYAVYKKTMMQGGLSTTYQTTLAITFTDYPMACSIALATGQTGTEPRGGKAGSKVFTVEMDWQSMAAQPEVMPMVYDSNTKDLGLRFTFAGLDAQCQPEMTGGPPGNSTITVTAFDATHIEGTLNVMGGGAVGMMDTFMGTFNFPICNLPDQPSGMCCVP